MLLSNRHVFIGIYTIICHVSENVSEETDRSNYVVREGGNKAKFGKLLNSIANVNEQRLKGLKDYSYIDRYNTAGRILRLAEDKESDPVMAVIVMNENENSEIFDSDVPNVSGNTPVRDTVQEIADHNYQAEDSKNKILTEKDRHLLQKLLYIHINRSQKDSNDYEEVKLKKQHQFFKKLNEEDTSDGEEIIQKKRTRQTEYETGTSDSEEGIAKREDNSSHSATSLKQKSEDILVHGNETIKLTNNPKQDKKQILRLFKSCNKAAIRTCKKACIKASKGVCHTYRCSSKMKRSTRKECKIECKRYFSHS